MYCYVKLDQGKTAQWSIHLLLSSIRSGKDKPSAVNPERMVPIANDKPHFLGNHHIYIFIFMLYVMSVLRYVFCHRKTSQKIRTINVFREKHDYLWLVRPFFEFVWAYLSYLKDMKKTDTIYWGIPWRVWRYQRGIQNPLSKEEQTTQWPKEKGQIKVITKLPNSEQSYKGKVKTHKYANRKNQSTTGKQ
jgi:hypothetical protein